jgi:hypothetical protein
VYGFEVGITSKKNPKLLFLRRELGGAQSEISFVLAISEVHPQGRPAKELEQPPEKISQTARFTYVDKIIIGAKER